jgi:pSer/pThr/pTyr-binding forkhead associated (FHA) protein
MPSASVTRLPNGERVELADLSIVGRLADSTVVLHGQQASRQHARIALDGDGVWLEDLGSANGTFLNGTKISQRMRLSSGDRLRFGGDDEFEISIGAAAAAAAKPAVVPAAVVTEPASAAGPPAAAPPRIEKAEKDEKSGKDSKDAMVRDEAEEARRPGAWADAVALHRMGKRTKYIPPDEIKNMVGTETPAVPVPADITVPHLLILTGARASLGLPLKSDGAPRKEWSVGSARNHDLIVPDDGVSSLHAKLVNDGARWKVVDQMSANGTFVNGRRTNVSFLASGDRLRFGPVECIFQLPAGATGTSYHAAPGGEGKAAGGKGVKVAVALAIVAAIAAAIFSLVR